MPKGRWEVVGGAKGGVLVRDGQSTTSEQCLGMKVFPFLCGFFEELVFQALLESALFNHAKCSNMKSVNCLYEESGSSPSAACPQKKSVLKVTSCK